MDSSNDIEGFVRGVAFQPEVSILSDTDSLAVASSGSIPSLGFTTPWPKSTRTRLVVARLRPLAVIISIIAPDEQRLVRPASSLL